MLLRTLSNTESTTDLVLVGFWSWIAVATWWDNSKDFFLTCPIIYIYIENITDVPRAPIGSWLISPPLLSSNIPFPTIMLPQVPFPMASAREYKAQKACLTSFFCMKKKKQYYWITMQSYTSLNSSASEEKKSWYYVRFLSLKIQLRIW